MTCKEMLEIVANIVAILTFLGALGAWFYYQWGFRAKKEALEKYLRERMEKYRHHGGECQFGFLHLTAKTGLTEAEILQASFNNDKKIKRIEKENQEGFTIKILFQYNDGQPVED